MHQWGVEWCVLMLKIMKLSISCRIKRCSKLYLITNRAGKLELTPKQGGLLTHVSMTHCAVPTINGGDFFLNKLLYLFFVDISS